MREKESSWIVIFFAWVVSLVATLGSLFFSEIMGFPPCTMCWYQRICMYPLVLILLAALIKKDKNANVLIYSTPLVVIGWLWAFYHCLLIYGVVAEEAAPCSLGVPCSVSYFRWLGFVDIPTLSLMAFTFIGACLVILSKNK